MRGGVGQRLAPAGPVVSQVVQVAAVGLLVLATWAGMLGRLLRPDDAPYLLVTREVGDHPVAAALLLVAVAAAYAVLLGLARRLVVRWRHGAPHPPLGTGRYERLLGATDWVFARWWRVSLVVGLLWLPWYVSSFPGQPSPDPSNMITEFVSTRADFAGAPPWADGSETAPYVDYPTSSYLMTDGERLWSNHHPFFLMLAYGSLAWTSIAVFDSLLPALVVASALSALFTLVAFGRALAVLGALVPSRRVRLLALTVLALSPLVALWSLAEHKNQIFCAAFVWWLALLARLVHGEGPLPRRWYVETAGVSLVMAVSVQFGWIVLLAQAVALLVVRRQRVPALVSVALPALLVSGSIAALGGAGVLIPSDPIETKGVQLQVLGLLLNEHPDALTAEERAELERAFDLEVLARSFDPSSSDPLKSTGPLQRKTASFRWETVEEGDLDALDRVVLEAAGRHPGTALDGLFLKSYRYLDPLDEATDWYPPWSRSYERTIEGHQVAPLEINAPLRGATRGVALGCHDRLPCRVLLSHTTRTVVGVLLLTAAIGVRRRAAWLWALPFALQLAIAGVSPLSAGGRYVLASTYGLAVVLMLLAVDDRRGRTPTGSRGSSTPSRRPSPAPWPSA